MRQATLFDFTSRPIPVEGWMHERDGRGWIYRSNAEAVVHDLNRMPSGMGIWPRILQCKGYGYDGWDLHHYQCRGSGSITKLIRTDGTVRDFLSPFRFECVDGKPAHGCMDRYPLASARIEDDELVMVTEDGRTWSEMIVPDSECPRLDVHPFDPEGDPEHFLIACLHAGLTGSELVPIAELPYSFAATSPLRPEMDTVMRLSREIGIVPRMSYDVHHITEFIDIYPVDRTCARCLKHRKDGTCQSGHEIGCGGYCWHGFVWNGKPYPKRTPKLSKCRDGGECEA